MPGNFKNPFRPGAGHPPPYLAGREGEFQEFNRLLSQEIILENMVLTGLRGTGKTVLLEAFKPVAIKKGWRWAGTDLSESASISEGHIVQRLLADLSIVTSNIVVKETEKAGPGFTQESQISQTPLNHRLLVTIFEDTPGLISDKLKAVLEFAWQFLSLENVKGLVFAYDEAQNLSDQPKKEEYPLSALLEVFASVQRKGLPILLVLTGLPTLFPKLVTSRTYSERMFHVVYLGRLSEKASRDAIVKPIEKDNCPVKLSDESVKTIIRLSDGYPYFLQFICRDVYDAFLQGTKSVPVDEIVKKLDADFFAGRWSRATDRQRELLTLIARLENSDSEFTVSDILSIASTLKVDIGSNSNVYQMLRALTEISLVFKNRYGKYTLAVPLLAQFIRRETGFSNELFD